MNNAGTMRCPDPGCMAPMLKRVNSANGSEFYGCSRFPDCRETRGVPEREKMRAIGAMELPGFETDGEPIGRCICGAEYWDDRFDCSSCGEGGGVSPIHSDGEPA